MLCVGGFGLYIWMSVEVSCPARRQTTDCFLKVSSIEQMHYPGIILTGTPDGCFLSFPALLL